jgi:hypothetical protein
MSRKKDELAKLKARVEQLERAAKPPEPFVSDWQPINPIDRLSMPRSTMLEMAAAIPDRTIKDIVRDNSGPTGPTGMAPSSSQITGVRPGGGPANVPGSGTGWSHPAPLGPSMHQRYVDAQLDAAAARDRRELIMQKAREQAALKAAKESK